MMKYSWKSKYTVISCILFVVMWECIAVLINNDIYLPKIECILEETISLINDKNFYMYVSSSFARTVMSYSCALILSVVLGILTSVYPFFRYLITPLNSFIKTIPTLVLVVLALVWFDKDKAPFIVGFAIIFPILYEGIQNSLCRIDGRIMEMASIYEVSLIDKFKKIYIPTIKFYIMNIFVSTLSLTFKVVIAGEVHGQPKFGIGSQIQLEKVNFNITGIFAWILIIMLISYIFEFINMKLNKMTYRWLDENIN
ncbi:ABC transporter permease [uncultured Clostridium sp.]|uniref:ABC transporter permease n=1 Tax=uncultured Clostridium sp. TaxID=59620 RepID=UPI0025E80AA4|nr:ABC transporter permease subunit [uncultured Clostridium sp.]